MHRRVLIGAGAALTRRRWARIEASPTRLSYPGLRAPSEPCWSRAARARPSGWPDANPRAPAESVTRVSGRRTPPTVVPPVPRRCLPHLTVAAPTLQATSSCDPVPPEQPIAPTIFPPSMSGIPPREATMPSILSA